MEQAQQADTDAETFGEALVARGAREPAARGATAAEKILNTLKELATPDEDADEMGLMLATVCAGLERQLGPQLPEWQEGGQLDEFVLALTRFLATHRSDRIDALLVVEMPMRPLPAGTRLHRLDQAIEAASEASSPL